MIFFISWLIILVLLFLEVSFLPHFFTVFGSFLILPYLVLYSHRDKTIHPFILTFVAGLILDSISGNALPIFSISFLISIFIGKVFFAQFDTYGESRANLIVIIVSLLITYLFSNRATKFVRTFGGLVGFIVFELTNE